MLRTNGALLVLGYALAACAQQPAPVDSGVSDTAAMDANAIDVVPDTATIDATPRDVNIDRSVVEAAADVSMGDVYYDPGMCGPSVRMCLCGCAGSGACQSACIQSDTNCNQCFYDAATMCCPGESNALDTCITENNCVDMACLTAHCMPQLTALNNCFAMRQQSDPACRVHVQACLGPDYPAIHCVM